LQAEIEAVTKVMIGNILRDRVDSFVVRLQRVCEVEGSHIERVFKLRPYAHELSMRVDFHSRIICSCTLENDEYPYTVLG